MRFDEFHTRNAKNEQRDPLSEKIIGAAIEVHRILGPGLSESMYHAAICHELEIRGMRYSCGHPIEVVYKGTTIGTTRLDLLVEDEVIVELKACDELHPIHRSQCITYLRLQRRESHCSLTSTSQYSSTD